MFPLQNSFSLQNKDKETDVDHQYFTTQNPQLFFSSQNRTKLKCSNSSDSIKLHPDAQLISVKDERGGNVEGGGDKKLR